MIDLPIEKQLSHALFLAEVDKIQSREVAIAMLKTLHLQYLRGQADFVKLSKKVF